MGFPEYLNGRQMVRADGTSRGIILYRVHKNAMGLLHFEVSWDDNLWETVGFYKTSKKYKKAVRDYRESLYPPYPTRMAEVLYCNSISTKEEKRQKEVLDALERLSWESS